MKRGRSLQGPARPFSAPGSGPQEPRGGHGATPWKKHDAAGGTPAVHLPRPQRRRACSRPAPSSEVRAPERLGAVSAPPGGDLGTASPLVRLEICSAASHIPDFKRPETIWESFWLVLRALFQSEIKIKGKRKEIVARLATLYIPHPRQKYAKSRFLKRK